MSRSSTSLEGGDRREVLRSKRTNGQVGGRASALPSFPTPDAGHKQAHGLRPDSMLVYLLDHAEPQQFDDSLTGLPLADSAPRAPEAAGEWGTRSRLPKPPESDEQSEAVTEPPERLPTLRWQAWEFDHGWFDEFCLEEQA